LNGGDGGNRTRVQTSNRRAFYMLISQLIFDFELTKNNLLNAYLLVFRSSIEAVELPMFTFTMPPIRPP